MQLFIRVENLPKDKFVLSSIQPLIQENLKNGLGIKKEDVIVTLHAREDATYPSPIIFTAVGKINKNEVQPLVKIFGFLGKICFPNSEIRVVICEGVVF